MVKKDINKKDKAIKESLKSSKQSTKPSPKKVAHSLRQFTQAIQSSYNDYLKTLTPRLTLIDVFLVFLVLLGVLQFIYVLIVGNFPFNAFLGGFISCVGQFVLTVSLRLQVDDRKERNIEQTEEQQKKMQVESADKIVDNVSKENTVVSKSVFSPERAFGDYIFASLILHFSVIHFIN